MSMGDLIVTMRGPGGPLSGVEVNLRGLVNTGARPWSSLPGTGPTANVVLPPNELIVTDVVAQFRSLTIPDDTTLLLRRGWVARGNVRNYGEVKNEVDGLPIGTLAAPVVLDFLDVNEAAFIGADLRGAPGNHDVVETDTGFWNVLDHATTDIRGTAVLAWTRLGRAALAGERTVRMRESDGPLIGWVPGVQVGLASSNTKGARGENFWKEHEELVIERVDGFDVTFTTPLRFDHPMMDYEDGVSLGAQAGHLSRTVRMAGRPGQRPHLIYTSHHEPHFLQWVEFEQFGTKGRLGRYVVHEHHCGEGSRGSVLEGLVAKHCANSFVVNHASNGTYVSNTVGFDVEDGAIQRWFGVDSGQPQFIVQPDTSMYGWDKPFGPEYRLRQPSFDVEWDRLLGIYFWRAGGNPAGSAGARINMFALAEGGGCTIRDCSGSGIGGSSQSAIFAWREGEFVVETFGSVQPRPFSGWNVVNCDGNNGRNNIVFNWLNTLGTRHPVDGIRGTNAGLWVNEEGAYTQSTFYKRAHFKGTPGSLGVVLDHVNSNSPYPPFGREDSVFDANGGAYAYQTTRHTVSKGRKQLVRPRFSRYATAGLLLGATGNAQPDVIDAWLPDFTNPARAFEWNAAPVAGGEVRVYSPALRTVAGVNSDYFRVVPGSGHPTWARCRVEAIAPFTMQVPVTLQLIARAAAFLMSPVTETRAVRARATEFEEGEDGTAVEVRR